MTALDAGPIRRLLDDTGDERFVLNLMSTYRSLLSARVARVVSATGLGDAEEGLDAALSLKVSSQMTGVSEVGELAAQVEGDLRAGDLRAAREHALLLPAAARYADEAITAVRALSDLGVPTGQPGAGNPVRAGSSDEPGPSVGQRPGVSIR